jgi:hypothetical protein
MGDQNGLDLQSPGAETSDVVLLEIPAELSAVAAKRRMLLCLNRSQIDGEIDQILAAPDPRTRLAETIDVMLSVAGARPETTAIQVEFVNAALRLCGPDYSDLVAEVSG